MTTAEYQRLQQLVSELRALLMRREQNVYWAAAQEVPSLCIFLTPPLKHYASVEEIEQTGKILGAVEKYGKAFSHLLVTNSSSAISRK